ncbi:hypothetical protein JCM10908_000119 [Rhodotorula pacifica]|uniref:uncharacterized protein n=1 Tax=Rhodotorula pacifica TaxID=1495444 RepID=UPI00317C3D53
MEVRGSQSASVTNAAEQRLVHLALDKQYTLCMAVVRETYAYERRPPLAVRLATMNGDLLRERLHEVLARIKAIVASLCERFETFKNGHGLLASWSDWQLRNSHTFGVARAMWNSDEGGGAYSINVYLAALQELLVDLEGVETQAAQNAHSMATLRTTHNVCICILLSRTPTAMLDRMRDTLPKFPSPEAFRARLWERAALLRWIRYAPRHAFPNVVNHNYYTWNGGAASVLSKLREATTGVLLRIGDVVDPGDQIRLRHDAQKSLEWLGSPDAAAYYGQLDQGAKAVFCTLVKHIAAECRRVGQHDGAYIGVSYAWQWSPFLIEHWMMSTDTEYNLPAFPGSGSDVDADKRDPRIFGRFAAVVPGPTELHHYALLTPREFVLDWKTHQSLCEAVVHQARAYLGRGDKPAATTVKPGEHGSITLAGLNNALSSQHEQLCETFASIGGASTIAFAWRDWQYRDLETFRPVVLSWIYQGSGTVYAYFAVLQELIADLVHASSGVSKQHKGLIPEDTQQHAMHAACRDCAAILLARTPTAMLERMRRSAPLPCPPALFQRSWEQPNLLPWVRSAPALTYPTGKTAPAMTWTRNPGASVEGVLENATKGILQQGDKISDRNEREHALLTRAGGSLDWLGSEPVRRWYLSLATDARKTFSTLLHHIAKECHRIGQADGYFIALNYAMLWTPILVESWMMKEHGHRTPAFPGSPSDQALGELDPQLFGRFGTDSTNVQLAAASEHQLGIRGAVRYRKATRRW